MSGKPTAVNGGTSDDQRNLVTFRLEQQIYALPLEPIEQIIEIVKITPVPQVNPAVEGIINFHGAAVPVVNLRRYLGLPEAPLRLHTPIILVHLNERLVGLIVDEVMDVLNRPASQIIHPRSILPEALGETRLLQGLVQTQDDMVMLLDADHLFLPQQTRALAQITEVWPEIVARETPVVKAPAQATRPKTNPGTAGKAEPSSRPPHKRSRKRPADEASPQDADLLETAQEVEA